MGTNTLSDTGITTDSIVTSAQVLQYFTAFDGDLVPRTAGVPADDGGALGSATTGWSRLYSGAGLVGTPAWTFQADPDTGVFWIGANQLGFATAGTLAISIGSTQTVTFTGIVAITGPNFTHSSAVAGKPSWTITNTTDDNAAIAWTINKTRANPADGDNIFNFVYFANNDADAAKSFARMDVAAITVAAGAEEGRYLIRTMAAGSLVSWTFQGATATFGGSAVFEKFVNLSSDSQLTIATGVITATESRHSVDTQSDDATDDLDTINGGTDGDILILQANHTDRTVVVKDGTGNIILAGDFSMDSTSDTIMLMYDVSLTAWMELSRSSNA